MNELFSRSELYAGESLPVSVTLPDGSTAAEVRFTGGASVRLAVALDDSGALRATGSVSSAVTLALPTACRWGLFVTGPDGNVTCYASGAFTVLKLTSEFRDALKAVDAAIASFGSNPNRSITVGEISITYKTLDDLLALRSYYGGLVASDEGGDGAAASGKFATILTRF